MDQLKKNTESHEIENPPFYNYELVVSQYQILNSLQNNQFNNNQYANPISQYANYPTEHFSKKQNRHYDENQHNQINNSLLKQVQVYERKSKSDSIINLINSDSNSSYQSEISKPTSIQNDFSKIKKRILNAQKSQKQISNKSQKNRIQRTEQNEQKQILDNWQQNKQIILKDKEKDAQSQNITSKTQNPSLVDNNNRQIKKQNQFEDNQNIVKKQDQYEKEQNSLQKKDIQYQHSRFHLIKTIPQFVIGQQHQNQSKSFLKQRYGQYQQQNIKGNKYDDYIQNKLTTPSLNNKNKTNTEDIVQQQQDFQFNSQLQQDYFEFIYHELLAKNKDNIQLKQQMNKLNLKLQHQQQLRLQLNFNKQKIEEDIIALNKQKTKQNILQIKQFQASLKYYKKVSETLDKSVEQKQKLLFQYFTNKQNSLDKLQHQNYIKILQLKSQLNILKQQNQKRNDNIILMNNQRFKKMYQQQKKQYLKLKAQHDSIQTEVQYLNQKKQQLIFKTLRYLQCAKGNVQRNFKQ